VQDGSRSATVDRADGGGASAGGRIGALVDDSGDGDGSSATDAGDEGPGSVPESDRESCVQPVNDIPVAMSAATTMGTRLGMVVHPISTVDQRLAQ
jgi:hypothetical protein